MKTRVLLGSCGLASCMLALAGCTMEAQDGAESVDEAAPSAREPGTSTVAEPTRIRKTVYHSWGGTLPNTWGTPIPTPDGNHADVGTYWCFFMGGAGDFQRAVTDIYVANNVWMGRAAAWQGEAGAQVYYGCAARTNWWGDAGYYRSWTDPPGWLQEPAGLFGEIDLWDGRSMSFLSGVEGYLTGGGEYALIRQHPVWNEPSTLEVGCSHGYTKAWGRSFYCGNNSPKLATLAVYGGGWYRGDLSDEAKGYLTAYTVSAHYGASYLPLIHKHDGICAMTDFTGDFNGTGEGVQVYEDGARWSIQGWANGGTGIIGQARCWTYYQVTDHAWLG